MLLLAGRLVGFALLAGSALAVLAAVTLLPAYAEMLIAQYERDCEKVRIAQMVAHQTAHERMIAAFDAHDAVLTRRLAAMQLGLAPDDEVLMADGADAPPPSLLLVPHYDLPPAPDNRVLWAAHHLKSPQTRRGLLLLAGGAMLSAMLCFVSPENYRRKARRPS